MGGSPTPRAIINARTSAVIGSLLAVIVVATLILNEMMMSQFRTNCAVPMAVTVLRFLHSTARITLTRSPSGIVPGVPCLVLTPCSSCCHSKEEQEVWSKWIALRNRVARLEGTVRLFRQRVRRERDVRVTGPTPAGHEANCLHPTEVDPLAPTPAAGHLHCLPLTHLQAERLPQGSAGASGTAR
eukprot:766823-Hanusia_phi.AAC.3